MTARRLTPGQLIVFAMALSFALCASQASAAVYSYRLHDHAAAAQAPPSYGLRLDNLFLADNAAWGGVTTFSFDNVNSIVLADIDDEAETLRIFGTVRGGTDDGVAYDTEVQIFVDFTYTGLDLAGFDPANPDLMVPQGTGSGTVTVTQEINNAAGLLDNVYNLDSRANNSGNEFNFKNTTHRGHTGINGWGWVRAEGTTGTQDWLFTTNTLLIPEPASWGLALLGVAALVVTRRRR